MIEEKPENESPRITDAGTDMRGVFVMENASYFAQTFAPLNDVFGNSGPMKIVSEESEITVVVAVGEAGEDGGADVDCALLEANQESLRDCMDVLFTEPLESHGGD